MTLNNEMLKGHLYKNYHNTLPVSKGGLEQSCLQIPAKRLQWISLFTVDVTSMTSRDHDVMSSAGRKYSNKSSSRRINCRRENGASIRPSCRQADQWRRKWGWLKRANNCPINCCRLSIRAARVCVAQPALLGNWRQLRLYAAQRRVTPYNAATR